VSGDDCLCGAVGAQPSHRSEPVLELAVVGFHPVVGVAFDVVPRRRDQFIEHHRVHRRSVGDHLGGTHLQHDHRPPEEPPCRHGVAADADEHVDDLAVLVDGAVHVPPDTVDLDVGLVSEPSVARRMTAEPGHVGQQRGETLHPPEDGEVVGLDAPLEEQFLDVSVRQVVPQVQPDGDHDDEAYALANRSASAS